MAFFSNSDCGDCFTHQCSQCKYGDEPCPIAFVQMAYNYDAHKNEVATNILDALVGNDGTCYVLKLMRRDIGADANQLTLAAIWDKEAQQ